MGRKRVVIASFPQAPMLPGTGHVRVGGAAALEFEDLGKVLPSSTERDLRCLKSF